MSTAIRKFSRANVAVTRGGRVTAERLRLSQKSESDGGPGWLPLPAGGGRGTHEPERLSPLSVSRRHGRVGVTGQGWLQVAGEATMTRSLSG